MQECAPELNSVEEWREVPGSQGFYEVSNYGRIRSWRYHKRWQETPLERKPFYSNLGYVYYRLRIDGKDRNYAAHRLVMLAFVGPSDLDVNHIDGNKLNNRLINLEYISHRENLKQAVERRGGHWATLGEKSHLARLSNKQIEWIRRLSTDGYTNVDLMEIFGISRGYLIEIKNNRRRT